MTPVAGAEAGHIRGVRVPPCTDAALANARRLLHNEFELVGEAYRLADPFSWRVNPSRDKEWQIAQHKHYWALDLLHAWRETGDITYLRKWIALTSSWLDEMPTGFITASDTQVEARRVEHWVYAYTLLHIHPVAELPCSFVRRFIDRLAHETRYIAQHLKPVRNHRTFQLFAVCLSSLTLPFPGSAELARFGVDELTKNLLTDILPDGVQVELSTHYHQLVLETAVAFLELTRAHGISVDRELEIRIARALRFAMHVQWPDGHLPLLNDADDGDQHDVLRRGAALFDNPELLWAATLGREGSPAAEKSALFDVSGYFVLRDGCGQHVTYDCGRLGEGSHSHYDVFNFCFYANAKPLIVDPGRYTYSSEPRGGVDWRHWFKSTAAHNTVAIDGLDQTRYLSRTKHGPDAEVRNREYLLGRESDWVRATVHSHEYAALHERFFLYMAREYLWIVDRIDPADGDFHDAVLRFHLAEACRESLSLRPNGVATEFVCTDLLLSVHGGGAARPGIETGWVSTRYGVKHPAPVLAVSQRADTRMSFASFITPCSGGAVPAVSWKEDDGVAMADIFGTTNSNQFHDTLVAARHDRAREFELPGLRARARDLAIRRDARQCIVYVVASGAEHVYVEGRRLPLSARGTIEWHREND